MTVLSADTDLTFPDCTVISASAGTGKTHTLTMRFLQLLLSPRVSHRGLRNILAVTFTNNAAEEMRQRILAYLKGGAKGQTRILEELAALVPLEPDILAERCRQAVDDILDNYAFFQVQTIDSFLSRVFRLSAIELGFPPSLNVSTNASDVLETAWEEYLESAAADPKERSLLRGVVDRMGEKKTSDSKFAWNPAQNLHDGIAELYGWIAGQDRDIVDEDGTHTVRDLRSAILEQVNALVGIVRSAGFEHTAHFGSVIESASRGDVDDVVGRKALVNLPFKKSGVPKDRKTDFDLWAQKAGEAQEKIGLLIARYAEAQAEEFYRGELKVHRNLARHIDRVSRRESTIVLADVNRRLMKFMTADVVPQLYTSLGETIYHYLIDEFQDTSLAQWRAVRPLLDETLAKDGSVFVVGDMKQSIYGFRNADWRIMRHLLEEEVFPQAPTRRAELTTNYRSDERILAFNRAVFQERLPRHAGEEAARASGLSTSLSEPRPEGRGKGYAEISTLAPESADEEAPEKLCAIIEDCRRRGYRFAEITVLTPRNSDVVAISGWLNDRAIPFISFSSLDIRTRPLTSAMLSLLRFLDSPIDDLAFASFLLSEPFLRIVERDGGTLRAHDVRRFLLEARNQGEKRRSLYTLFRASYPEMWEKHFEHLLNVTGYLPTYDLVCDICRRFDLFATMPEEEATIARLLEKVVTFERDGSNTLKEFLEHAADETGEGEWSIKAPSATDAVRVMTVHKAKGLANRVVIFYARDSRRMSGTRCAEDAEDGIRLLHITKDDAEKSERLRALYEAENLRLRVDDLNKLYVALTRAREELYVVNVRDERFPEPSAMLPVEEFPPAERPPVAPSESGKERVAPLHHVRVSPEEETGDVVKLALLERRRGEILHDILSRIVTRPDNPAEMVEKLVKEFAGEFPSGLDRTSLATALGGFLSTPSVAALFEMKEGGKVLNEQEFVTAKGELYRMDRVVVAPSSVTVIDYKTGDDSPAYDAQVRGYMNILRDVHPGRQVRGMLAFIDRRTVREVQ